MNKLKEIQEICETFIETYKDYPTQIKNIDQAIACGMSIAAEHILEIINECN